MCCTIANVDLQKLNHHLTSIEQCKHGKLDRKVGTNVEIKTFLVKGFKIKSQYLLR